MQSSSGQTWNDHYGAFDKGFIYFYKGGKVGKFPMLWLYHIVKPLFY